MLKFSACLSGMLLLFTLSTPGWPQPEGEQAGVPPILESPRPLQTPDTRDPAPPKATDDKKTKPPAKTKSTPKTAKKAKKKKLDADKKKNDKNTKKKTGAALPRQSGPTQPS